MHLRAIEKCLSCGAERSGKFCSSCGEKVVDRNERTAKYFLLQVLSAITFADSRAWKSVKLLFTRPGKLPREYVDGRRKPYLSPLPLFFLINFLYFLIAPFDTFNTHLNVQLEGQVYSHYIEDYGIRKIKESSLDEKAFTERYDAHSENISKSILIVFALILALPFLILFRNRSRLYFDHLIFSLSFVSFLLLAVFILMPYLIVGVQYLFRPMGIALDVDWNGIGIVLFALLITGTYLGFGVRTFYKETWRKVLWKTPILLASLVFTLLFYRFILFFVTIWTM